MSTGRQLVSSVRSMHKLISADSSLTDRAIFSEIKRNSLLLIKRETNLRKLWATDTVFTTIPCMEMIEVPVSECCGYVDGCTIARTKEKLPSLAEGNYQYIIQGVYSINALSGKGKKLKEITVNRYMNLLKLPIIKNDVYYMVVNGYLYVTNPNVTTVRISALFESDIPNSILFPDCNCGQTFTTEEICKNPLDRDFYLPGYLEKQVLEMTSQKLMSTYYRLKSDVSDNDVDGQAINTPNNA